MGLQPSVDNDFYIKESRDMITIVQSMIIAGNYWQVFLFYNQVRCFDDDCIRLSLFVSNNTLAHFSNL